MKIPDKVYDTLKWACLILLPASAVAYRALSAIWGLPLGEEIPLTIGVIETFGGAVLGISTAEYNRRIDGGT